MHSKLHFYLALAIAFSLPLASFTPILIALMFLNWLLEGSFKNKCAVFFKNKFALLFSSFFLLHLIGLLYTENVDFGLKDIEVKMSLLIFPLLFSTRPFENQEIKKILNAFIGGCILTGILMLGRASYLYISFGENNFFYQNFAFLLHPGYLSMYLNVSIVYILKELNNYHPTKHKFLGVLIVLFFLLLIILLSSKMGFLCSILILLGFLIYYVIKLKKYLFGISAFLFVLLVCFSLIKFVPKFSGRLETLIHSFKETEVNKTSSESTDVRRLVWGAAKKIISENFVTGVGTGDSKDALMTEYKNEGLLGAYEHKLNAHNEYFQVFVALGVIGFLLLLFNLFVPLMNSLKYLNFTYGIFLIIIIINFLVESMFETQAGVMFYAFFNSLLCFELKEKKEIEQH